MNVRARGRTKEMVKGEERGVLKHERDRASALKQANSSSVAVSINLQPRLRTRTNHQILCLLYFARFNPSLATGRSTCRRAA